MRTPLTFIIATAALALSATAPSLADRAAADACASRLPADAKLIYTATIGSVAPGINLADNVRSKARELVMSGRLTRDQAPPAAQAAGACLKQAM
jgi:hypothetical protein